MRTLWRPFPDVKGRELCSGLYDVTYGSYAELYWQYTVSMSSTCMRDEPRSTSQMFLQLYEINLRRP